MTFQSLSLDCAPPLAIIALTRTDTANRVDRTLIHELRDAVEAIASDRSVRAAILTASAGVFCAGWSGSLLGEIEARGAGAAESGLLGTTFQFLTDAPLPFIAAIDGDAFSAGLELALACDLRLATDRSRFALPDVAEGRIPMAGGTQRLPRIIGHARAVELVLTGRTLSASEALQWGMINAVCAEEEMLSTATDLARRLSGRGPIALRLAKEAVNRGADMPLSQAMRFETDLTILLQTTSDREEGVQAFIEKREPHFEGH